MKKASILFTAVLCCLLSFMLCSCVGCSDKIPEKPDDTTLEFWLAEDVSSVDFSAYIERAGVFGAYEYFGQGYAPITEDNEQILPQYYVLYTVGGYPDTSDKWNYITRIQITDPNIHVYGITCATSLEEFDKTMKDLGYKISEDSETMHSATLGKVCFRLVSYNGEGKLSISVDVSNRWGIMY